jgi:hypothetical protein
MAGDPDQFCKGLLDRGEPRELREWLKEGPNTLGLLQTNAKSVTFVEKIYGFGAVKAFGVEIDGGDNTGKLVIELPKAASKRAPIFKLAAAIAEENGFDATKDTGQKYLFVMMD